ncbi:DUF4177 domain-containing protein [Clostridium sp. B9]|uniref:DUF4177 domain-containing protein n=1 Tax=Clostridium sp. B9 TaxID=3423224 RepID=UPI003D2EC9E2
MYDYKFINVPVERRFRSNRGESFEKCKEIVSEQSKQGWRLKQIVVPVNEKTYADAPFCYEIILEKKIE